MCKIAIMGKAMLNKEWEAPRLGRKNRIPARQRPGGFVTVATQQSAALGLEPFVFTRLGGDDAGHQILGCLRELDAGLQGVQWDRLLTPTAQVIIRGDERTVLVDSTAPTASWRPVDSDWEYVAQTDVVVAGGTLDSDGTDHVLMMILGMARKLGKPLCLNPSRIHCLEAMDLTGVRLMQVSMGDFENLGFPEDCAAAGVAEAFLRGGVETVIVTDSANGEWGFNHIGAARMPAIPDRQPRFPVGCGEAAFIGHVADLTLNEDDMYGWLNVGTLAGGFFVETGTPAGWPEIRRLNEQYPAAKRMEAWANQAVTR